MQEIFYEESATIQQDSPAKTKYFISNFVAKVILVLIIAWCIYVFTLFDIVLDDLFLTVIVASFPIVFLGLFYLLFRKICNKYSSDFDYTFVSGDIRISKVIASKKRKHILRFSTSNIEKIGKCGSELFNRYQGSANITKFVFTSNIKPSEDKEFYYIVINNPDKKLLILECSKVFIVNILKYSNISIIEKDMR